MFTFKPDAWWIWGARDSFSAKLDVFRSLHDSTKLIWEARGLDLGAIPFWYYQVKLAKQFVSPIQLYVRITFWHRPMQTFLPRPIEYTTRMNRNQTTSSHVISPCQSETLVRQQKWFFSSNNLVFFLQGSCFSRVNLGGRQSATFHPEQSRLAKPPVQGGHFVHCNCYHYTNYNLCIDLWPIISSSRLIAEIVTVK